MAVLRSSLSFVPSFSYSAKACSKRNNCCIKESLPVNAGQFMMTFKSPMLLFFETGSFCWINIRYASSPFEPVAFLTTSKGLWRSNDERRLYRKWFLCRSVSVKSTGSTAWLGFARSCSISSANLASMEATYCSNAHDHSRHAAISLSLLVCSNVGGFGNSLHHCLLSSVEVLETPSTALVAAWAARAAASAACTIRRATSMPSTPSTPGVAAAAAGDPPAEGLPTCGESMSPISASSSKKLSKENQISHFRSAANSLSTPGKLYPQSSTCIFQNLCLDLRPTSIYPEFQCLPVVF